MTDIDEVLKERDENYGDFERFSEISQGLKSYIFKYGKKLNATQREALSMCFHKAARILNGNPNYEDSWVDIEGYAKLGSRRKENV